MTRYSGTPTSYAVFNELDRHGLLLGLPRIEDERNAEYKQRLMDVFVNRASSTYRGLINGITRELGLSIVNAITISPVKDADGDPLLTAPAIVFQDTKCIIYSDYGNSTKLLELDRYNPNGGAWSLDELIARINGTGYFTAALTDEITGNKRSMTIFNQSTVENVLTEDISGSGSLVVLENQNLIPGTVTVRSPNLNRVVSTETDLTRAGDYTIRHKEGLLIARGAPAPGSFIRYSYRNDSFVAQSSPVILHNLQSSDFQTKMFEQITDDDGETQNGLPTPLGADIISELMTVYGANWGA